MRPRSRCTSSGRDDVVRPRGSLGLRASARRLVLSRRPHRVSLGSQEPLPQASASPPNTGCGTITPIIGTMTAGRKATTGDWFLIDRCAAPICIRTSKRPATTGHISQPCRTAHPRSVGSRGPKFRSSEAPSRLPKVTGPEQDGPWSVPYPVATDRGVAEMRFWRRWQRSEVYHPQPCLRVTVLAKERPLARAIICSPCGRLTKSDPRPLGRSGARPRTALPGDWERCAGRFAWKCKAGRCCRDDRGESWPSVRRVCMRAG